MNFINKSSSFVSVCSKIVLSLLSSLLMFLMWFVTAVCQFYVVVCSSTAAQISSGLAPFLCLFCMVLVCIWMVLNTQTKHQDICSCLLHVDVS